MSGPLTVFIEIEGTDVEVATMHVSHRRDTVTTSWRYADSYLSRPDAYALGPGLPLSSGAFHAQGMPAPLSDCSPDRWGRNLIAKKIRGEALLAGQTPRAVTEVDYLLGVSDESRQGALRIRTAPGGSFQNPEPHVPRLIELPTLLHAADEVSRDGDDLAAVKVLLDAGTGSLGGARPKASVRDGTRLLIAKFPHANDEWNVMAWEKTALDLAAAAGVRAPRSQLIQVGERNVLLLDRFDRTGEERIGYVSAMTLLERSDGDSADYTELAEAIADFGAGVEQDLQELWLRIAFSIAIHNTDDHLRNHGFLRLREGWRLAPVFDVNPNPVAAASRVTGIGGGYRMAEEIAGLRSYAEVFNVSRDQARRFVTQVVDAVSTWADVATKHRIADAEQTRFSPVFAERCAALAEAFA